MPKIHERKGLRAHETKGRKKRPSLPRSEDQREPSGKNWAGIPKGCQELEILEACSTAKMGLGQLKGSTKKNTRNEGQMCPSQAPSNAVGNQKAWSNHS